MSSKLLCNVLKKTLVGVFNYGSHTPGLEKDYHHDNYHLDYHDYLCDHHHVTWT